MQHLPVPNGYWNSFVVGAWLILYELDFDFRREDVVDLVLLDELCEINEDSDEHEVDVDGTDDFELTRLDAGFTFGFAPALS